MRLQGIVLVGLLFFVGCDKKDETQKEAEFAKYIDRFVEEGKARGVTIDVSNLTMKFVPASEIPGYCGQGLPNPPLVKIAQTDACWDGRSDTDKEILVFHEMGHAVLGRAHFSGALPNCEYRSMMFDGNQFGLYTSLTDEKRKYYLDELFDPATPPPSWSGVKTNAKQIFYDTIAPDHVWRYVHDHIGKLESNIASSHSHSLSIQAAAQTEKTGYWILDIIPPVESGSTFMLSVKIKCSAVTGNGVFVRAEGVAIKQGVGVKDPNYWITTQPIKGNNDFKEYTLMLHCYPSNKPDLIIYLGMFEGSTGTVYFDDVRLTNYY